MKKAEPLSEAVSAKYTIYFPSGKILLLDGIFGGMLTELGFNPTIRNESDELFVIDPRCLITRNGGIVYDPRENLTMPKELAEWMDENPEWPSQVEN